MNRLPWIVVGVAAVVAAVVAGVMVGAQFAPHKPAPKPPPMTALLALDLMRNAAASHEETLAKFKVIAINGQYVRAIVSVPEEFTGDMPADIMFEYGWHLVRVEPVRGKLPGPG